ncbi:MAG: ribosome maturation factor RimM [Anaerolineaceae bacterium]|nr:ribosome maturation factor RimM [Anaerolineaceae bacterium]
MNRHRPMSPDRNRNETGGSPGKGGPLLLAVGKLRRPHGIHGEILMDVLTDFPDRLGPGKEVYVGESHRPYEIIHMRRHDPALLVTLDGIDTRESAGELRNQLVYVYADGLPDLPEGEYYHHQLMGLRVEDEAGNELGVLEQILVTGANDVYLVRTSDDKELLLPAIHDVVLEIDIKQGKMVVRPMDWY